MKGKVPLFIRILHLTYGVYLRKRFHVTFSNDSGVDISKGPYLLLSNHVGTYDPIVISASMDRHVRWVAGAYLFKLGLLRLVLTKGATAIPKQQGRSDMSSLKAMQNALKEGSIVGLFPEGTRTWDGDMVDLDYQSLAKMIRIFRCPVIFMHLEGVYGECPRWATERRTGSGMHIRITSVMEKEEIASLSLPEFADCIKDRLAFSNDQWKTKENYHYASPLRAEGLERALYLCPKCGKVASMASKGASISCSCGASATLNEMDDLESSSVPFHTVREWHLWEREQLFSISDFPEEKGVLFQTGDADNNGKLETVSEDITVSLSSDTLVIRDNVTQRLWSLPLSSISSFVINAKQTMELYTEGILYRIRLLPLASSLKYLEKWESIH